VKLDFLIICGLVIGSFGIILIYIFLPINNKQAVSFLNPLAINGKIEPLSSSSPSDKYQYTPLTLEGIFATDHTWIATLSAQHRRTLIATGDIIPARSVNYQAVKLSDFTWSYRLIADVLKSSDLTFANLESPLITNCPSTQEGMIFCGDSKATQGLVFGGIDIVNLANNHTGNHGLEGLDETVTHLSNVGIKATGRNNLIIQDVKGVNFGFLGYNLIGHPEDGISWADPEKIIQQIIQARNKVDILIVAFHWGTEYVPLPTDSQIDFAHLAIDQGADLVIGNHPHWIQPVEMYQGKIITYAFGNTIFDQLWSQKTREGLVGKYTFYDKQLVDLQLLPLQIDNYGQPHWVESSQKNTILDETYAISYQLKSNPL
jgi:hypothetical protein